MLVFIFLAMAIVARFVVVKKAMHISDDFLSLLLLSIGTFIEVIGLVGFAVSGGLYLANLIS